MDEYNVYKKGEFVETLTKPEIMEKYNLTDKQFESRVGSGRGNYTYIFIKLYKRKTYFGIPESVLKDWDETMEKIREKYKLWI